MKHSIYNHCAGSDRVPVALQAEISESIGAVKVRLGKGGGTRIREAILDQLVEKGWSKPVSVARESEMTITSIKSHVGLCLQTGNMARMYADLLKLQQLYMENAISAGVMIVPSQPLAKAIGDNITHATRLAKELELFKRVIHIPMMLFIME